MQYLIPKIYMGKSHLDDFMRKIHFIFNFNVKISGIIDKITDKTKSKHYCIFSSELFLM